MAAFLPIALGISGLLSRIATAVGVAVLIPILSRISDDLTAISRAGVFQAGFMKVADAMNGIQMVGLQVYIVNQDFLDHIAATRWAITYFSDVTAMKQLGFLFDIYRIEVEILDTLKAVGPGLLFYTTGSYQLQHAMLGELRRMPEYARVLNSTALFVGAILHQDLQNILAAIQSMATVSMVLVTLVIAGGGGAQPVTPDTFWKGFGRIAAILALIVAFVGLLGVALRAFNESAWIGIVAVATIALTMGLLFKALSGYKWDQIGVIAVSLLLMASFVAAVGVALRTFDKDAKNAVEALKGVTKAMTSLLDALKNITEDQMRVIGRGLLYITLFVGGLGLALRTFSKDALKPVENIGDLFDALIKLAQGIAAFKLEELGRIGLGFLGIVVFLALLGVVLTLFNADVLNALPGLGKLLDSIGNLAKTIADLSTDRDKMIAVGLGLLAVVGFIALLGLALDLFSQNAVAAMPALGDLFDALIKLANAITSFTPDELVTIGIAFAVIAGFVLLLAIALRIAEPGLHALAEILQAIEGIMDRVSAAASKLWSILSPILSSVGDLLGLRGADLSSAVAAATPPPGAAGPAAALAAGAPVPGVLGIPAGSALEAGPGGAELAGGPALAALGGPGLPALGGIGGPQRVDQSVNVQGGLNVNISAERLEADSAQLLSDQIIQRLSERLAALRGEQDFRVGVRPAAPA